MEAFDPEIIAIFFDEANTYLEAINDGLLKIEASGASSAHVNSVFRGFHSIKGASGMLGFDRINRLTHRSETLLDLVRSNQIELSREVMEVLFLAVDGLTALIAELKSPASSASPECFDLDAFLTTIGQLLDRKEPVVASQKGVDVDKYRAAFIDEAGECLAAIESNLVELDQGFKVPGFEPPQDTINELFRRAHQIKAAAGTMGFHRLGDLMHALETVLEKCRDRVLDLSIALGALLRSTDRAKAALTQIQNGQSPDMDIEDLLGELQGMMKVQGNRTVSIASQGGLHVQSQQQNRTMRVDVERLDHLMNMSSELVIARARFTQILGDLKEVLDRKSEKGKAAYCGFQDAIHQMELISGTIQKAVMNIRMIPVGPMFGRFKRVVRDICKDLGKEITLDLKGEDTEVDKQMIDELSDPLTHLVRNGIDHGIESPEEREKAGKPRQGTIVLSAFHRGNKIVICVEDDGQGINYSAIKKKAVEVGLYSEEKIQLLSQKELTQLIFHPGFSTARKVTNISGRGVGMDIVKKKIDELKGIIDIESTPGKGTTFVISLPLTLATQKCLMCEINKTSFGLPLESVLEIVKVSREEVQSVQLRKFIRVRDKVIPVKAIQEFFSGMDSVSTSEDQVQTLVILRERESTVALSVDRLLGEEEIVIKSLSRNMTAVNGISGVSVLGSGRVALILDVAGLFEKGELIYENRTA